MVPKCMGWQTIVRTKCIMLIQIFTATTWSEVNICFVKPIHSLLEFSPFTHFFNGKLIHFPH
uniref:Uncharacterized protein n=1 Tax=Anguilla anguilla TaxID=7936 RepID=A0A0E9RSD1_ANGAN